MTEQSHAETILRNFQKMYLAHIVERQAIPMTDPIFTLTDALYAATTDLLGPPPEAEGVTGAEVMPTDDECVVVTNTSSGPMRCREPVVGKWADCRVCQSHLDLFHLDDDWKVTDD